MRITYPGAVMLLLLTSRRFAEDFQITRLAIKENARFMDIEVRFFYSSIGRIIKSPEGSFLKKQGLSVIEKPEWKNLTVNEESNTVHLKSTSKEVGLNLNTEKISFVDLHHKPLFIEKEYSTQIQRERLCL